MSTAKKDGAEEKKEGKDKDKDKKEEEEEEEELEPYLGDDDAALTEVHGKEAVEWARGCSAYDFDIKKCHLFQYIKDLREDEQQMMIDKHVWNLRLANAKFYCLDQSKQVFFKIHWGYNYKIYKVPNQNFEDADDEENGQPKKKQYTAIEEGSPGTIVLTRIHAARKDTMTKLCGNHNQGNNFEFLQRWESSYLDMYEEKLRVEMWEYKNLQPNLLLTVVEMPLIDVVKGNVNLKFDMRNTEVADKKVKGLVSLGTFYLSVVFQENTSFVIKFNNWRADILNTALLDFHGYANVDAKMCHDKEILEAYQRIENKEEGWERDSMKVKQLQLNKRNSGDSGLDDDKEKRMKKWKVALKIGFNRIDYFLPRQKLRWIRMSKGNMQINDHRYAKNVPLGPHFVLRDPIVFEGTKDELEQSLTHLQLYNSSLICSNKVQLKGIISNPSIKAALQREVKAPLIYLLLTKSDQIFLNTNEDKKMKPKYSKLKVQELYHRDVSDINKMHLLPHDTQLLVQFLGSKKPINGKLFWDTTGGLFQPPSPYLIVKTKEAVSYGCTPMLMDAGTISGEIEINTPISPMWKVHLQQGELVPPELLDYSPFNYFYLAVQVKKARNLISFKESGSANPFVAVTWAGQKQKTSTVVDTTNPDFDETLYFHVRCFGDEPSEADFEREGNQYIDITVWDDDPGAGSNHLGSVKLFLHQIMGKNPNAKPTGAEGDCDKSCPIVKPTTRTIAMRKNKYTPLKDVEVKTRSFKGNLILKHPELADSTLSIEAYFRGPERGGSVDLQDKKNKSLLYIKHSDFPHYEEGQMRECYCFGSARVRCAESKEPKCKIFHNFETSVKTKKGSVADEITKEIYNPSLPEGLNRFYMAYNEKEHPKFLPTFVSPISCPKEMLLSAAQVEYDLLTLFCSHVIGDDFDTATDENKKTMIQSIGYKPASVFSILNYVGAILFARERRVGRIESLGNSNGNSPLMLSASFLLDMGKGDIRDHAILLCSLLLSEGIDAYVCIGQREEFDGESGKFKVTPKDHWWVMIRDKSSDLARRYDRKRIALEGLDAEVHKGPFDDKGNVAGPPPGWEWHEQKHNFEGEPTVDDKGERFHPNQIDGCVKFLEVTEMSVFNIYNCWAGEDMETLLKGREKLHSDKKEKKEADKPVVKTKPSVVMPAVAAAASPPKDEPDKEPALPSPPVATAAPSAPLPTAVEPVDAESRLIADFKFQDDETKKTIIRFKSTDIFELGPPLELDDFCISKQVIEDMDGLAWQGSKQFVDTLITVSSQGGPGEGAGGGDAAAEAAAGGDSDDSAAEIMEAMKRLRVTYFDYLKKQKPPNETADPEEQIKGMQALIADLVKNEYLLTEQNKAKVKFPRFPYARLEVVFNDKNLWANVQKVENCNPLFLTYNFDSTKDWVRMLPFGKNVTSDQFGTAATEVRPQFSTRGLTDVRPQEEIFEIEKAVAYEIESAIMNVRDSSSLVTLIENEPKLKELLKRLLEALQTLSMLDPHLCETAPLQVRKVEIFHAVEREEGEDPNAHAGELITSKVVSGDIDDAEVAVDIHKDDSYHTALLAFKKAKAELSRSKPSGYKLELQLFQLNTLDTKESRQFILSEKEFMEDLKKESTATYCIGVKIFGLHNDVSVLRMACVKLYSFE